MKFDSSRDVISKHKPLFDSIAGKNDSDKFILSGGRASFKSFDIALMIVITMLVYASKGQKANAVVFMQKKEEIRDGAFEQIKTVIKFLGIESKFTYKVSPFEIRLSNGASIRFYGLNKQDGKKANAIDNIAVMWFEELDQFESQASIKPTIDTFMRNNIKGERIKFVYSFNPPRSRAHWVFNYVDGMVAEKIHTTYLDDDTGNDLLPAQMLEEIEATKENDYEWYQYNYLGVVSDNAVVDFPPPIHEHHSELDLGGDDYVFIGVDSATTGKDGTRTCAIAYNTTDKVFKLLGFDSFDDEWIDGYTSYKVGQDIVKLANQINANAVYVDRAYGGHILDALANEEGLSQTGINFGGKVSKEANGRASLALNKRAEMYTLASDLLRAKKVIAYCDTHELEKQLEATELLVSRDIKVIDKGIIKKRIGRSPDEADSFVLAIMACYDKMELYEEEEE